MKNSTGILLAVALLIACGGRAAETGQRAREPVVGLPCEEGFCEIVFIGLPDTLAWNSRIAPPNEPGAAMRIDGVVRDNAGRPVGGVIVYAYHTDARGYYPTDERHRTRHGRLRGWAQADAQGRYRFDSVRPAGYPNSDIPEHVHMHVIEPGRCTYYIGDINFDDDPRMTKTQRERVGNRGGYGLAKPTQDKNGTWLVTRDIVLGENVPGYPER